MNSSSENLSEKTKKHHPWLPFLGILLLFLVLFGAVVAQTFAYSEKVLPGVRIGGVPVGKMSSSELKDFLESMNNKLIGEGLNFSFVNNGKTERLLLSPIIVTEGNALELMSIDIASEVDRLINYGKEGGILDQSLFLLKTMFKKPDLKLEHIKADQEKIISELKERLVDYENEPINSSVVIKSLEPLGYEVSQSVAGQVFQYEDTVNKLIFAWSMLKVPDVEINQLALEPKVKEANVFGIVSRLPVVLDKGSIALNYKNPQTRVLSDWFIGASTLSEWLEVQKIGEDEYGFGLKFKKVKDYLETNVIPKVFVKVRDAKFEIDENGKIVEFQGSRPGVELDIEETYKSLNQAFLQRSRHDEGVVKTVQLVINQIEPNVTTGEANDLGISEILGTGISDFKGSPTNRIKNIKNAVKKLNGVLLKPDEEFSAIKYTKPYSEEGGYLPELVIKGNEIRPEIGGGLCQIGTTLFRMAMNSAMPITARRNHSLVVNYYNDLENGLPGTDATIYDPHPDFKFKNDTGHHLLIQTSIDEENGRLYFTLWGTNDGREGWYESPIVEKWIDYGPTKFIETTKLAPGQKQCQHAFRGAEASFKYIRELPNGEKEEKVFESYYRPLPEICLVGVEEKTQCEGEDCPADLISSEAVDVPVVIE